MKVQKSHYDKFDQNCLYRSSRYKLYCGVCIGFEVRRKYLIMAYMFNCVEAAHGQNPIVTDENKHRHPKPTNKSSWKVVEVQISLSNIHIALSNTIGDRVTARLSTTDSRKISTRIMSKTKAFTE